MKQSIMHIALLVKDYDEAIDFYVNKLKFTVKEDTLLSDFKLWVLIQPPGSTGCCLLLAKAANELQSSAIGNQSGLRYGGFSFAQLCKREIRDRNSSLGNIILLQLL